MSTDLQVMESREIVITDEQTDLIKKTICAGATDAEMKLFFFDCQRRGVHPLDKLIHFTKRDGKYVPITSIDFFRIRAHESHVFDGEDEPTYEVGEDGLPDKCKYVVYRLVQGRPRPWHATARWSEYYPGEKLGFMWRKMPYVMLTKCAEALALRKAFPAELQGLYVKEEMDQVGAEHKPLRTGAEMLKAIETKQAPSSVLEPTTEEVLKEMQQTGQVDEYPRMKESASPPPLDQPSPENPPSVFGFTDKLDNAESIKEWSDVMNDAQRYDWSPENRVRLDDHAQRSKKRLTMKVKK